MQYGIKAYGKWRLFRKKEKFIEYLLDWIAGTDGAERERAEMALFNLHCGINKTDTDGGI